MAINAPWHEKHRMPRNATPAERLKWHMAHAKHCACRPFTAAMRAKLQRAASAERTSRRAAAEARRLAATALFEKYDSSIAGGT